LAIAAAITAISVAILAVNIAAKLGTFGLIATGIAALVVGIVYAYNKFETFRNIVNSVLNGLIGGFETFANAYISAINLIIRGMNLINPFSDIPSLPTLSLGRIGGDGGGNAYTGDKDLGVKVPASGNISLPSMPSPSAPMAGGGGSSGGGGGSQGPGFAPINGPIGYVGGIQDRIANRPDVTINVSGGISSAADIGRSVVDALTQYTQVYGPLNLAVR